MFSAPLTLLYKAQHLSRSQTLISVWRLLSRLTQANVWRAETESHAIPQFWSIWSLLKGYNRVRREAHSPVRSFLFAFAWSLAFALGSLQLLFSSFYPTKMPRKYPAAVASWSKARVASLPGESEINAIFRVYELEPSLSLPVRNVLQISALLSSSAALYTLSIPTNPLLSTIQWSYSRYKLTVPSILILIRHARANLIVLFPYSIFRDLAPDACACLLLSICRMLLSSIAPLLLFSLFLLSSFSPIRFARFYTLINLTKGAQCTMNNCFTSKYIFFVLV